MISEAVVDLRDLGDRLICAAKVTRKGSRWHVMVERLPFGATAGETRELELSLSLGWAMMAALGPHEGTPYRENEGSARANVAKALVERGLVTIPPFTHEPDGWRVRLTDEGRAVAAALQAVMEGR